MTKQRFGLNWLNLGLFVGVLALAVGACTRVESSDDDDDNGNSNSNGNSGNTQNTQVNQNLGGQQGQATNTNGTATGLTSGTVTSTSRGGSTSVTTTRATGGVSSNTTVANGGSGNVQACEGVPAVNAADNAAACNGVTVEAEPLPVDMIILMDRSISNSYAIGSESATPATGGELTRWDVLTTAMQALATSEKAQDLGASITFFSLNGGRDAATNCTAADYAKPIVPLGLLRDTGSQIVDAMAAVSPSGLTPIVPALTGVYQYAMAEKKKDSTREKVVVMISDGFPTLCDLKAPSDVSNVIKEAASAPVPIKTFIIGIGSPNTLDGAKFNLQNYARSGDTGKPPFVLDETQGADGVRDQLVKTLLNISGSAIACDYEISAPSAEWVINPNEVMFTYQPNEGGLQEIPKVGNAASCSKSANGGWYFDNPESPKKISVCPCTCTMFGAGRATVVYGCKPNIIIE